MFCKGLELSICTMNGTTFVSFGLLKAVLIEATTLTPDSTAPSGETQQIIVQNVPTGGLTVHASYFIVAADLLYER